MLNVFMETLPQLFFSSKHQIMFKFKTSSKSPVVIFLSKSRTAPTFPKRKFPFKVKNQEDYTRRLAFRSISMSLQNICIPFTDASKALTHHVVIAFDTFDTVDSTSNFDRACHLILCRYVRSLTLLYF